jgi:hypothetical protein
MLTRLRALLNSARPARARAIESCTRPMRSFRVKIDSSFAASSAILVRRSGVYSTRSAQCRQNARYQQSARSHAQTPVVPAFNLNGLLMLTGKLCSLSPRTAESSTLASPFSLTEMRPSGIVLLRSASIWTSAKISIMSPNGFIVL